MNTVHRPDADVQPFAAWLTQEAAAYRARGTAPADWLADQIDGLAKLARFANASDGPMLDDRLVALEGRRWQR